MAGTDAWLGSGGICPRLTVRGSPAPSRVAATRKPGIGIAAAGRS
jgi:hypothetical protein